MEKQFEIAAGSVIGTEHQRLGKNNQDTYYCIANEQAIIALVCDGCGSQPHSEVGAKIGAPLIATTLLHEIIHFQPDSADFWKAVHYRVLENMKTLVLTMVGGNLAIASFQQIVFDYFLFTVVGVIITPRDVSLFSIGDGVIQVNNESIQLGTFLNNAPPYFAYNLLNPESRDYSFKIHQRLEVNEVSSIIIGSDGVQDLMAAQGKKLPGKDATVPAIEHFLEDKYFKNPDLLRRQLALMNREVIKPNWQDHELVKEAGLLPDDTTLMVMRRKPQ